MTAKSQEEKLERRMSAVRQRPENRSCAECGGLNPVYANMTHHTFVCTACSGVHREFSHRVKGITASRFTDAEVTALENAGNAKDADVYLAEWEEKLERKPEPGNTEAVRQWIRYKYLDQMWVKTETRKKKATAKTTTGTKAGAGAGAGGRRKKEEAAPKIEPLRNILGDDIPPIRFEPDFPASGGEKKSASGDTPADWGDFESAFDSKRAPTASGDATSDLFQLGGESAAPSSSSAASATAASSNPMDFFASASPTGGAAAPLAPAAVPAAVTAPPAKPSYDQVQGHINALYSSMQQQPMQQQQPPPMQQPMANYGAFGFAGGMPSGGMPSGGMPSGGMPPGGMPQQQPQQQQQYMGQQMPMYGGFGGQPQQQQMGGMGGMQQMPPSQQPQQQLQYIGGAQMPMGGQMYSGVGGGQPQQQQMGGMGMMGGGGGGGGGGMMPSSVGGSGGGALGGSSSQSPGSRALSNDPFATLSPFGGASKPFAAAPSKPSSGSQPSAARPAGGGGGGGDILDLLG